MKTVLLLIYCVDAFFREADVYSNSAFQRLMNQLCSNVVSSVPTNVALSGYQDVSVQCRMYLHCTVCNAMPDPVMVALCEHLNVSVWSTTMNLLVIVKYQYIYVQCCETLHWYVFAQCCGGADVGLWPSQLLRSVHMAGTGQHQSAHISLRFETILVGRPHLPSLV